MSPDKNLVVMTTGSGGTVNLVIMSRTNGTTFSTTDLQGSWRTSMLATNNNYWGRALTTIDSSGNVAFKEIIQSSGTKSDVTGAALVISPSGIITSGNSSIDTSFQSIISIDKRFMIGTTTQDSATTPTPTLLVFIK